VESARLGESEADRLRVEDRLLENLDFRGCSDHNCDLVVDLYHPFAEKNVAACPCHFLANEIYDGVARDCDPGFDRAFYRGENDPDFDHETLNAIDVCVATCFATVFDRLAE
jgi:hypothetical protein